MAKDYAKVKKQSTRGRGKARGDVGARFSIVVGVLIGLFIAGLMAIKLIGSHVFSEQVETIKSSEKQPPAKKVEPIKPPQPRFDFYTMLPKVDSSASSEQLAGTKTNSTNNVVPAASQAIIEKKSPVPTPNTVEPTFKPDSKKTSQATSSAVDITNLEKQRIEKEIQQANSDLPMNRYVLALAAFKDYAVADKQKAQYLLKGLDVKIKKVQKKGDTFYRIWMGPYASIQQAKQQQHALQEQHIKSVVTKEN